MEFKFWEIFFPLLVKAKLILIKRGIARCYKRQASQMVSLVLLLPVFCLSGHLWAAVRDKGIDHREKLLPQLALNIKAFSAVM